MNRLLVAYATTEGHTRTIAAHIGERLRAAGYEVDIVDTASPEAAQVNPTYMGVVVGGSVHNGRHQSQLEHFARDNQTWLRGLPVAVFSVSLAVASSDPEERSEAQALLDEFMTRSGVDAILRRCFAGALLYTRYDYFKRTIMRHIARHEGGDTDTSSDHVYTDWNDVNQFADEFVRCITLPAQRSRP